ncbi:cytochrome P450 [Yinghuangia seranimata]|uniref:cytochrome P450 n=1 Tax=Yinghuangia seranimata TaxID=408067 RepID=UPI00248D35F3|nr:cytochrome P450 [Yinghuangia seranimata]MDI2130072.1 cytochrome P450 [Yinghuangia seranimata]
MPVTVRLPEHLTHPFAPAGRADPYPAYRWLQTHDPVHHDPSTGMWLVTGHADCAAALREPGLSAQQGQRERARDDALPPSMLTTDGAEHRRLRAPGALLLGAGALASVWSGVSAEIGALVDELTRTGKEVDVVADIGTPLSTGVFARLFGLPGEDRAAFAALAQAASVNLDPLAGPAAAARGRFAMGMLTRTLDAHAERLLAAPVGTACPMAALVADTRLTRAEALGILALAVVGGWQPLAEATGNALARVSRSLVLRGGLAAANERTALRYADELLRLETPIPFTARVAVRDVALPGGTVPVGARVLVVLAAANRDPAVYDRPDELLPDRDAAPHLAFGGGGHYCLAAQLVRQALASLLPELARRFPHMAASAAPLDWDTSRLVPRRLRRHAVRLTADEPATRVEGRA